MTTPTLPDADLLVLACLRTVVNLNDEKFGTQIPADILSVLPYITAKRFGGSSVDPRFLDRATVDVQTWAGTRREAMDLAFDCRDALRDAWLGATVFTGIGHIAHFAEVAGPSELRTPDQADRLWRSQATYSLFLRPAN